jgi:hypothetical protein
VAVVLALGAVAAVPAAAADGAQLGVNVVEAEDRGCLEGFEDPWFRVEVEGEGQRMAQLRLPATENWGDREIEYLKPNRLVSPWEGPKALAANLSAAPWDGGSVNLTFEVSGSDGGQEPWTSCTVSDRGGKTIAWAGGHRVVETAGEGNRSARLVAVVGEKPPDPPQLSVEEIRARSLNVSVADAPGQPTHLYRGPSGAFFATSQVQDGAAILRGLCDGTAYRIRALSAPDGWRLSSDTVTVTTADEPPRPPEILDVTRRNGFVIVETTFQSVHDLDRIDLHAGPGNVSASQQTWRASRTGLSGLVDGKIGHEELRVPIKPSDERIGVRLLDAGGKATLSETASIPDLPPAGEPMPTDIDYEPTPPREPVCRLPTSLPHHLEERGVEVGSPEDQRAFALDRYTVEREERSLDAGEPPTQDTSALETFHQVATVLAVLAAAGIGVWSWRRDRGQTTGRLTEGEVTFAPATFAPAEDEASTVSPRARRWGSLLLGVATIGLTAGYGFLLDGLAEDLGTSATRGFSLAGMTATAAVAAGASRGLDLPRGLRQMRAGLVAAFVTSAIVLLWVVDEGLMTPFLFGSSSTGGMYLLGAAIVLVPVLVPPFAWRLVQDTEHAREPLRTVWRLAAALLALASWGFWLAALWEAAGEGLDEAVGFLAGAAGLALVPGVLCWRVGREWGRGGRRSLANFVAFVGAHHFVLFAHLLAVAGSLGT